MVISNAISNGHFIGGPEYLKILGSGVYCACGSLFSPRVTLEIQEQEEQQEKGCLMVMADPSDLGHGKN